MVTTQHGRGLVAGDSVPEHNSASTEQICANIGQIWGVLTRMNGMRDSVRAHFSVWFRNDGGPLIVLPRELLPYWDGSEKPKDGRVIATDIDITLGEAAGTDYARACAIRDAFAVLPVGDGLGVVIGLRLGITSARWVRAGLQRDAMVIMPYEGDEDSEDLLLEELQRLRNGEWHVVFLSLRVVNGDLILMHASSPGWSVIDVGERDYATIGYYIAQRVDPGVYAVEEATLTLPDGSVFGLCRFRRT